MLANYSEREIDVALLQVPKDLEEQGHDAEGTGYDFWDDDGGWNTDFDNDETVTYTSRNWRTGEEEERSYTRYGTLDKRLVPDVGYARVVEQFGGEGQGDQYYIILSIEPLEGDTSEIRYFKIDGYYASHYGRDLDGPLYEVVPRKKTIIVYDKKGK